MVKNNGKNSGINSRPDKFYHRAYFNLNSFNKRHEDNNRTRHGHWNKFTGFIANKKKRNYGSRVITEAIEVGFWATLA